MMATAVPELGNSRGKIEMSIGQVDTDPSQVLFIHKPKTSLVMPFLPSLTRAVCNLQCEPNEIYLESLQGSPWRSCWGEYD